MGYIAADCAVCHPSQFGGSVKIALEFVLPNKESGFVKADWDGDQMNGFFALFKVVCDDGSVRFQDAVPVWLRFPADGPTNSYDEFAVKTFPLRDTECGGAIAERVY